jgi:hypothetical protein
MGLDTKTYWLSARQSQCDFDFDASSVHCSYEWIIAAEAREQVSKEIATGSS